MRSMSSGGRRSRSAIVVGAMVNDDVGAVEVKEAIQVNGAVQVNGAQGKVMI